MKEVDYVEIGKRIKRQRKKYNLTQEKLAEKVNVAPTYISEIERGTSICSIAVLVRIANELNLNLDNLVCGINISNIESTFKELLEGMPKKNHKLFMDLCMDISDRLKKEY